MIEVTWTMRQSRREPPVKQIYCWSGGPPLDEGTVRLVKQMSLLDVSCCSCGRYLKECWEGSRLAKEDVSIRC